ncbi:MAG TPA: hypothetical protein VMH35_05090 [Streptosporangiaceae bacterium]|nr:hypothetical protein [Streptosporangiaceae bacterium]
MRAVGSAGPATRRTTYGSTVLRVTPGQIARGPSGVTRDLATARAAGRRRPARPITAWPAR